MKFATRKPVLGEILFFVVLFVPISLLLAASVAAAAVSGA